MDNRLIYAKGLTKYYKTKRHGEKVTVRAVDGVSFDLHAGHSYGLIGSSGSGKSTLVKLIFNLEKPTSGEARLMCKAGLVLQDPYSSLCPSMTIEEIVAEPITMNKKVDRQALQDRIRDALAQVHLSYNEIHDRYPHQISGGQKQRVSIARAMIESPALLVLDEPTSMLDVEVKGEIEKILKELKNKVAVLLITHDIAFATKVCGHIMVMKDGKIIEECCSEDIMEKAENEYTKKLVLAATDLETYWLASEQTSLDSLPPV